MILLLQSFLHRLFIHKCNKSNGWGWFLSLELLFLLLELVINNFNLFQLPKDFKTFVNLVLFCFIWQIGYSNCIVFSKHPPLEIISRLKEPFILVLLLWLLLKSLISVSTMLLTIVKSRLRSTVVLRHFSTFEVLLDSWYLKLNLLKLALKLFLRFFDFGWGNELFDEI